MKLSKNMTMLFVFYFMTFLAYALPYGYMQTFLAYVGYDVLERGIIISGCAIVAIVMQFFVGYLCDKFKTDKFFYNLLLAIFAVSSYIMYSVTEKNFFVHLIFISLLGGLERSCEAVQDAWCLETDEQCKNNYGAIRAFGAIGWMIGSPIAAWIIESYGYPYIGIVFAGLSVVNVLITFLMQDAVKVEKKEGKISFADVQSLLKNKRFLLVTGMFLIINIIAMADSYTVVDKMLSLGASETLVGARWSIQAFTELPLFFAGGWLLKKFGDYKLLIFGTIMYVLRFILYAFVQTPELMIAVSLLQGVTFPLIMVSCKTLVDGATPAELRASGQTIASSIYIGVSLLIAPTFAGLIASFVGLDITLAIFGLSGLLVLVLGSIYKKC